MSILGLNGIYVFTGIPAPKAPIEVDADLIMRNVVLKNQVVVGTVNADGQAFRSAISDLGVFMEKWPETLKSPSVGAASHRPKQGTASGQGNWHQECRSLCVA